MSITYKRFSYLSERANVMADLHQALKTAETDLDFIAIDKLNKKIIFESQFFAEYLHSLLVEIHISQFEARSI